MLITAVLLALRGRSKPGDCTSRHLDLPIPGSNFQLKQRGIELGCSRLEGGRVHESPGHLALADVM